MPDVLHVDRPPRIQPELPFDQVEIPRPPEPPRDGQNRLVQIALPLTTIIGYILVSSLASSGRNPLLMIPMAISVLASSAFALFSYLQERKQRAESERIYTNRLIELNREMRRYHDMQRRYYAYNYPDAETSIRLARQARAAAERPEHALRSEARLWERRVDDADFGVVRLGMGSLPSTVTFVLGETDRVDTSLARAALKLADDSRVVSDIPVIIALRQPPEDPAPHAEPQAADEQRPPTPTTHALAVVGQPEAVQPFVRALLAHFVVFHAPGDARLYLLAPERAAWEWAEGLPHCRPGESGQCVLFLSDITPDQQASDGADEEGGKLEQYLESLRRVLAQRKIRLQDRDEGGAAQSAPALPFCLVVVDLLHLAGQPTSPLASIETDPAIAILLAEGAALNASVIFLVPERSKAPSGCRSVIEVEETIQATGSKLARDTRLHFRYAETGVNTYRYVGAADGLPDPTQVQQLAQQLSQLDIQQGPGTNLPGAVPFLDLHGYGSLAQLRAGAWHRWQASGKPERANWLKVPLGLMAGNKPRALVFSAKRDGVHGMVAGSTGSGKSELLISLIAGLAVNYDPSVLNFVLVDYKGGGAFKEFANLPHCVDIITNLTPDAVTRMFTAIQSELKRRQALLADLKNIVEYYKRGKHHVQPLPFLFIIIDEFAEMIADRAEYKAQLESITRVGRSLGVSLILAAQRPSGVTDQMRSNIKFRICLRVETPGESREMLRRTDAAYLPPGVPGRGYLQVGNEEIELIQVAYSGDRYVDPNQAPPAPVLWPNRRSAYDAAQDQEPPELYKTIIETLHALATEQGRAGQRAPWPGFLPERLALNQPLSSRDPAVRDTVTFDEYLRDLDRMLLGQERETTLTLNPFVNRWLDSDQSAWGWVPALDWRRYAMRPVVGLVDDPFGARQLPLVVDLPRGHVVIFGASGWGKTTFLRSLVVSLAATHPLSACHIYLLDLGGRGLGALAGLPHVGALITPDEEGYKERVEQLLRELGDIVERRKQMLSSAGIADIYEYNQSHPTTPQPAIVVAIDNFREFVETFGESKDDAETVLDRFVDLARQARPYGIHAVIATDAPGSLSGSLASLFTERFTLKLADATEYRAIVGGSVDDLAGIPGRGYTRIDLQPLSFQVAQPIFLRAEAAADPTRQTRDLEMLARTMAEYAARQVPDRRAWPVRVDALPKGVLLKQLLARTNQFALDATFWMRLADLTRQQWAASREPANTDWLEVVLGVVSGNRPRTLRLEAKRDGVHALIAGGTGAGKSELLMTLIVSLALRYDPGVLNFVLVDYKGGGAFAPFEQLPHCVDITTNLNKTAVRRVFTAITAELQRRQHLNAQTNTRDIVEYRRAGHHQRAPYPHLVIIIDEYAEMITESPEFGEELDRITRIGRSLGVHLFLASQRPTGVSDQMRANIKLRMCLRVEQVETSRELLRRSDAAFLPSGMPGRGYLQVGNEHIELIQVAYTGERDEYAALLESGEQPRFYDEVVRLANQLLSGPRPRAPWPPPLRPAITLAEPLLEPYLDPASRDLVTLGRTGRLALNPFAGAWLAGQGTWPGIDWEKTVLRAIAGLIDNPYAARQQPLVVDLTRGHAIVFGASGWGKTTFLRSLLLSLASTHSPGELQAQVLDLGGRSLEVLRELPHVGSVIIPDDGGYEERVQQLWRELNEIVDDRKVRFSQANASTLVEYNRASPDKTLPALVVLIDNLGELIETFGNRQDDPEGPFEAFVGLLRQGRAYGVHFVVTLSRPNALSSKLYALFTERFTLRLADAGEYGAVVGTQVAEVEEIPGRGYARVGREALAFQAALVPGSLNEQGQVRDEIALIRAIGQQMYAAIRRDRLNYPRPLRVDALPKSSSYRELLARVRGVAFDETTFLDQLYETTRQIWDKHTRATGKEAEWLQVTLGVISGDKPRKLRLEAQYDGVHGMVAGGTGSGKSELLMTLIVGLALNYSPDLVNFVLVDYKGGGAFKPFEQLPHCIDIVTNLNKAAVHRMFTAIDAEIRRRQALNAETGTRDIVDYRARGYHLTKQPYPHLFIIIDEYAEMIDTNPEYLAQLESITRVGRAQGVNLLLASQRPKGVTDQMRANIKLRLCLRVEQVETSRELLRKPDAAFLPSIPGRGYVQVGNERMELIQVSWSGEVQLDTRPVAVEWPGRPTASAGTAGEKPRLFNAAVTLAYELYGRRMAPRSWPGFLPERFSLESPRTTLDHQRAAPLLPAVADWLSRDTASLWPPADWRAAPLTAVVGLVDEPDEARQGPLSFDLGRNHLVVMGDAGSGKSTLLRTLAVSLAATRSPDALHLYALDLGGRNLRALEDLPHTGAVIYADEEVFEERMQRLFGLLEDTVEERQRLFSDAGANSLAEFNAHHPDRALPAVLVLIDNVAELRENYEALVDSVLIPLIRRSLGAGITFVAACNVPASMAGRMYSLFGLRVTLKQTDPDRYVDIVGRGAVEFDDLPGRGYLRLGRRPVQFHAAHAVGLLDAGGRWLRPEADDLRQLGAAMQAELQRRGGGRVPPTTISYLPPTVVLGRVLDEAGAPAARRLETVLGRDESLRPAQIDLGRTGPHCTIIGPPLSGKTTVLRSWILALAMRYAPAQARMVLVDTQRKLFDYGGQHQLGSLPHVLAAISEPDEIGDLAVKLDQEGKALAARTGAGPVFVLIDNFDEFCDELKTGMTRWADMARRYGREGLHMVVTAAPEANRNDLQRRIMASGFGIGLRTAAAVEALRVMRLPSGLRDKELPVGRGFLVRSGQLTMVQVATPYEGEGLPAAGDDDGPARALDTWVQRIRARYPDQRAAWSGEVPAAAGAAPGGDKLDQLRVLVLRGAQRDLAAFKGGENGQALIFEQIGPATWNDQQALTKLLREVYLREQARTMKIDRSMAEALFGTATERTILDDLRQMLQSDERR